MNYNERIKELRQDRDLTQAAIAHMLKTSQSYYSEYELGKRQLPLATLCQFYGVSADYVLGLPEGLAWPRPGRKQGYKITSTD